MSLSITCVLACYALHGPLGACHVASLVHQRCGSQAVACAVQGVVGAAALAVRLACTQLGQACQGAAEQDSVGPCAPIATDRHLPLHGSHLPAQVPGQQLW